MPLSTCLLPLLRPGPELPAETSLESLQPKHITDAVSATPQSASQPLFGYPFTHSAYATLRSGDVVPGRESHDDHLTRAESRHIPKHQIPGRGYWTS